MREAIDIQSAVKQARLEQQAEEMAAKLSQSMLKHMSPAGALGLPTLLDERRLRYGIIDECFSVQVAYDRILVYQIEPVYAEGGKVGLIELTDKAKQGMKQEAPRGVLISAGLGALDVLQSNGIDLGHIVHFCRVAPWRLPMAMIDGHTIYSIILRDSDIVGSEDLATKLRSGDAQVMRNMNGDHTLSWCGQPKMPDIGDDY